MPNQPISQLNDRSDPGGEEQSEWMNHVLLHSRPLNTLDICQSTRDNDFF